VRSKRVNDRKGPKREGSPFGGNTIAPGLGVKTAGRLLYRELAPCDQSQHTKRKKGIRASQKKKKKYGKKTKKKKKKKKTKTEVVHS